MSGHTMYLERRMEPADAVRVVQDGETIVVPIGVGEPPALLRALSERRRSFRGVTVFQLLPLRRAEYFDPDTTKHVRHTSAFLGGPSRPAVNEGWADYYPAHFSEIPELIRRGLLSSEVVFAHACAMDEHGYFAIGLSADYTMAAISRARAVVLEVNPQVPFCLGDCHVHVSQVAALVENDEPLAELPPATIGPVEQAIGGFVAELIPDGATLQIGIGGIPDAVVQQLANKNDLGVHSEMFGDGILALLELYARRFYCTRDLRDLRFGSEGRHTLCASDYDWGNKHIQLVVAHACIDDLAELLREIDKHIEGGDHGGAFVVFSKRLNAGMEIAAIEGSYASVIGGAPAAATVFAREVRERSNKDERVVRLRDAIPLATGGQAAALRAELAHVMEEVRSEKLGEVADEFDGRHTIQRALSVGSVDRIIVASDLRPYVVDALERGMARSLERVT